MNKPLRVTASAVAQSACLQRLVVQDLLALVRRGDPVVKRTAADIKAEKLEREKARETRGYRSTSRKQPRRTKVGS